MNRLIMALIFASSIPGATLATPFGFAYTDILFKTDSIENGGTFGLFTDTDIETPMLGSWGSNLSNDGRASFSFGSELSAQAGAGNTGIFAPFSLQSDATAILAWSIGLKIIGDAGAVVDVTARATVENFNSQTGYITNTIAAAQSAWVNIARGNPTTYDPAVPNLHYNDWFHRDSTQVDLYTTNHYYDSYPFEFAMGRFEVGDELWIVGAHAVAAQVYGIGWGTSRINGTFDLDLFASLAPLDGSVNTGPDSSPKLPPGPADDLDNESLNPPNLLLSVPEPPIIALLLLGLAGVFASKKFSQT